MPLSIPLPARAKIIINGAVIENSGSANITLTVHNKANILRDKDVLTEPEANTPAKEIYHAIQNAYLFEANKDEWLSISSKLLVGFETMWPEAAAIIAHVTELLSEEKLYNALRASRRLMAFEADEPVEPLPRTSEATSDSKPASSPRGTELSKIKGQIAELERRIAALDDD